MNAPFRDQIPWPSQSGLGLKLVIFFNIFCAWSSCPMSPSVSSCYSLALSAPRSRLQKERQIYWFLSIIKTNVTMNMVPLSTANPSEWMQWWPWKSSAVSKERSLLFFSAWKCALQIYGIHAKICARLCCLWAVGISAFSHCYCCFRHKKLDPGCIGVEDWGLVVVHIDWKETYGDGNKKNQALNKQKHPKQTTSLLLPSPHPQLL